MTKVSIIDHDSVKPIMKSGFIISNKITIQGMGNIYNVNSDPCLPQGAFFAASGVSRQEKGVTNGRGLCYNVKGGFYPHEDQRLVSPLKKMTKRTKSNLLNALVILCTLGLVLYLSARGGDIGDVWTALRGADYRFILAAVGSWCVFMTFEAMGLHVFFRQQKIKIAFPTSLLVALIGSFYSSVTPAATGGQPMQVLALKRRGIPAGISSSGLAVKFFTFQTALLTIGALMWAVNPGIVDSCPGEAKWVVAAGFFLNGLSVAAVLLLAINKNIVRAILTLAVRIGKALRLVKDVARTASRVDAAINDFHASVDMLTHHPIRLIYLYLLSCLQVLGLMSIAYCVYRALGMNACSYFDILTLQFLLYIAASFTPLPGASGAQEGGFYIFFQHIFPADKLVGALLLWRFFTYYFTLIIGLSAVITDSAVSMRKRKLEPEVRPEEEETAPVPEGAGESGTNEQAEEE